MAIAIAIASRVDRPGNAVQRFSGTRAPQRWQSVRSFVLVRFPLRLARFNSDKRARRAELGFQLISREPRQGYLRHVWNSGSSTQRIRPSAKGNKKACFSIVRPSDTHTQSANESQQRRYMYTKHCTAHHVC